MLLEVAPARVGERLELLGALEEQVVVRRAVLAPAGEVRFAAVVPRRAVARVRLARHGPLEFRAHDAEAREAALRRGVGFEGNSIGFRGGLGRRRAGNFDSAAAGRHADQ